VLTLSYFEPATSEGQVERLESILIFEFGRSVWQHGGDSIWRRASLSVLLRREGFGHECSK
jgi:hypothetical protein